VQYGVGAEIPTHIHDTRTIDASFRAWADWVTISNDLFSFIRESQLENDIHTELQELFDDWDMGATERAGIVRHVQVLRDWMSGSLAFMFESPRYEDGRSAGDRSTSGRFQPPLPPRGIHVATCAAGRG
jgi:hypothetical protein